MENKCFFFQPSFTHIKVKETNFKTYRKANKKKKNYMIQKLSVKYIGKFEFLLKETLSLLFSEFNVKPTKKKSNYLNKK
jgi:hypothetical protein